MLLTFERMGGLRYVLIGVAVLVMFFLLLPIVFIVALSFGSSQWLAFPPPGWSLRWYRDLLADPRWLESALTSAKIAVLVTILSVTLGLLASFALVRGSFPGRAALRTLFLIPMVLPVVVFAVAFYAFSLSVGLSGTLLGFVLAHTVLALPFVVVTLVASFTTFDRRLEWAAASLGAARHVVAARVIAPVIAPGALTAAAFAFLTSFDEIVVAFFVVDPNGRTLPVEMYSGVTRQIDPTVAAAAVALLALTTVVMVSSYFFVRTRRRRFGAQGAGA
jgi:putative spermidine/putrescine transport system permease protein